MCVTWNLFQIRFFIYLLE